MTYDEQTRDAVRVLARLSRVLERGTGDLSLAHYRVLAAVAGGEERASRVAARLALGKPTISASVDALCRRGLLARETGTDQRVATLRLTGEGTRALAQVEAALVERMHQLLEQVPDRRAALAALSAFGPALDRVADQRLDQAQQGGVTRPR